MVLANIIVVWLVIFLIALFWAGVIALVVWGINRLVRHSNSPTQQTPIDIAKERYAKGEINKEQFEQIKKDLN